MKRTLLLIIITIFLDICAFAQSQSKIESLCQKSIAAAKNNDFATAKQAVNFEKQARYRKIALYYGEGVEPNVRFDVIEIYRDGESYRINHLPNAF